MTPALRQALGASVVERGGHLWLEPANEAALRDALHVLKDQGAQVGREVSLSRARFATIGPVQDASMIATVGAGVPVTALELHLHGLGLSLGPLWPQAFEGTVAQLLEGPSGGLRAIRGGRLESMAVRLDGVMADGRAVKSLPGPRAAAGPDLLSLFLGGQGRLGLITSAQVRCYPLAPEKAQLPFLVPDATRAVEALKSAIAGNAWLSSAHLSRAASGIHVSISLAGTVGTLARDRAALFQSFEAAGGRASPHEPGRPSGAPVEASWAAVEAAVARGEALALYRLSLASVIAHGTVEGVRLEGAAPWAGSSLLAQAFDPTHLLGGAP